MYSTHTQSSVNWALSSFCLICWVVLSNNKIHWIGLNFVGDWETG